jgi:hypothetical protein
MAKLLQPETEATDPRILRSRRMLMEALARIETIVSPILFGASH